MVSKQRLKVTKENAGKKIVRFLTETQFKKIAKRKPICIMIGGAWVELRSRSEKELRQIAFHKQKIRELQAQVKARESANG